MFNVGLHATNVFKTLFLVNNTIKMFRATQFSCLTIEMLGFLGCQKREI